MFVKTSHLNIIITTFGIFQVQHVVVFYFIFVLFNVAVVLLLECIGGIITLMLVRPNENEADNRQKP